MILSLPPSIFPMLFVFELFYSEKKIHIYKLVTYSYILEHFTEYQKMILDNQIMKVDPSLYRCYRKLNLQFGFEV